MTDSNGTLWWSRLVNSIRFIDKTVDALSKERSVILNMPSDIPWQYEMIDTLTQKYNDGCGTRAILTEDVSKEKNTPGEYLLRNYLTSEEQKKYWPLPGSSIEKYIAGIKNAAINKKIIIFTGIKNAAAANSWHKSISEYLSNADNENHCVFILMLQDAAINAPGNYEIINYGDYVTDYDCLMLCLTLLSAEKCDGAVKQYIAEIANEISCANAEIASILAKTGVRLAYNPENVTREAFADAGISVRGLSDKVNGAVWKAQVKHVFPKLEDYRRELIDEYKDEIQKYLPIKGSDGENVNEAVDVEIGQLVNLAKRDTLFPTDKYKRLIDMRNVRNRLAHGDPVDFETLGKLRLI